MEVVAYHLINFTEIFKVSWIKFMKTFQSKSMMNIKNFVKSNLYQLNWEIKEQANFLVKKNIIKTNAWLFVMKKYRISQKINQRMLEMQLFKIWLTNIWMKKNLIMNSKLQRSLKKHGYLPSKMLTKFLKIK